MRSLARYSLPTALRVRTKANHRWPAPGFDFRLGSHLGFGLAFGFGFGFGLALGADYVARGAGASRSPPPPLGSLPAASVHLSAEPLECGVFETIGKKREARSARMGARLWRIPPMMWPPTLFSR